MSEWTLTSPSGQIYRGATRSAVLAAAKQNMERAVSQTEQRRAKEAEQRMSLRDRLRALLDGMKTPAVVVGPAAAAQFKDAVEQAHATLRRERASISALTHSVHQMQRYSGG